MRVLLALVAVISAVAAITMPLDRLETFREKITKDGKYRQYKELLEYKLARSTRFGANPAVAQSWTDFNDVNTINPAPYTSKYCINLTYKGSANLWIPNDQCDKPSGGGGAGCQDDGFGDPCCSDGEYCAIFCPATCCNACRKSAHGGFPINFNLPETKSSSCAGKVEYKNSTSSTYTADGQAFSIQYGTGSCNGVLGKDVVSFGSAATQVGPIRFGMANHLAPFFGGQPFDGICGMAFTSLAVDHVPPPFQAMINAGLFGNNNFFDIWITGGGSPGGKKNAGILEAGGYVTGGHCADPSTISYVTLSSKTYYQFKIDSWTIGPKTSTNNNRGWQTIADTGTSLLAAPQGELDKMLKKLGIKNNYDSEVGLNYLNCYDPSKNQPNMVFGINGKNFNIKPQNYILAAGLSPSNPNRCYFGVQGFNSGGFGPSWIHGDVFLRNYCTTFDMGSGSHNNGARLGLRAAIN